LLTARIAVKGKKKKPDEEENKKLRTK